MRIEVSIVAGEPTDPSLGYSHISYVHPEPGMDDAEAFHVHLLDVGARLKEELARASASIAEQLDRIAQAP